MAKATHFLHPYYYRIEDDKVYRLKGRKWVRSSYTVSGYFLMQPDLVDLSKTKADPAAEFMREYGLRRAQAEKMLADGVLKRV